MSTNVVNFSGEQSQHVTARDNFFKDCPALMSDGRFITNWKPNCEMNNNISKLFNKNKASSWEYTHNLINQSQKVFDSIDNTYKQKYDCSEYYDIPQPSLQQDCNTDNCVVKKTNNNFGIGLA